MSTFIANAWVLAIISLFYAVCVAFFVADWRYLGFLALFCFALSWPNVYRHYFIPSLPQQNMNHSVVAEGQIRSLGKENSSRSEFLFAIKRLCWQSECHDQHVTAQLTWYGKHPALQIGDSWRLRLKLFPPQYLANPGEPDRRDWYLTHKIATLGTVQHSASHQLQKQAKFYLPIARFRQHLAVLQQKELKDHPLKGVITALSIGDHRFIQGKQWRVLQATGITHLVAISGLHIGLAALLAYQLALFLWKRLAGASLLIAAPKVAAIAALLVACGYSLLAGFALPAKRALIMLSVCMLANLSYRQSAMTQRLLLALGVIVLLQPFSVLDPGFWLSFSACFIILYFMSSRLQLGGEIKQLLRLQSGLFIGLAPLGLWFFSKLSLVSWVANLIAVPYVGFIIVPLLLISCLVFIVSPHFALLIWQLSHYLLMPLWWLLQWLAQFNWSVLYKADLPFYQLLIFVSGVLIVLAPRGCYGRYWGWLGIIPLFIVSSTALTENEIKLNLLNTGEQLAVIVQTTNHQALYLADVGRRRQHKTDYVVKRAAKALHLAALPTRLDCTESKSWQWDGWQFELQPAGSAGKNCFLRIARGEQQIALLPKCYQLSADQASNITTLLTDSSKFERIKFSAIELILIANKKHNLSIKQLTTLEQSQVMVYDTAQSGAIQLRIDGKGQVQEVLQSVKERRAV